MHPEETQPELATSIETLRAACPDLSIETVEGIFAGQFNVILIVNAAWIFRFPRYDEEVRRSAREAGLLAHLRGRLPLPIPDPVYSSFDPPIPGRAFFGYRRLAGEALYPPLLARVGVGPALDHLAAQLAAFLGALHGLSPVEPGLSAQVSDRRGEFADMYHQVRELLFPAMRPDARRSVSTHFESYLDNPGLHDFDPVPRHGDFGGSNILYDLQQGEATGVIDFSSCALGDPAVDLASISTLGDGLFTRILDRYAPDPSSRTALAARARFYRGTYALEEALAGLRTGDEEAYRSGMEAYM